VREGPDRADRDSGRRMKNKDSWSVARMRNGLPLDDEGVSSGLTEPK
jgi:hypothetical protein